MHRTIPVSEIMVTDVVTVRPDATVADAATLMRDERVSSVVVVRDDRPTGIVTEGDFASCLCDRQDLGGLEVADAMSRPLETIGADASIVDAAERLRTTGLEHLPVVEGGDPETDERGDDEDGALVGILTTTELSYFVPHLSHHVGGTDAEHPRRQVRSDTLYERDDWAFEYHGEDESTVSVGDVATFSKPVTAKDVETFAEATGDTNRLHLDADYAAETRFGQPIVHGVLANGLISAALARLPGLTIYLSQESSFLAPLSIGDRVTAVCEVTDALGGSKYRIETTVRDGSDEVVLEGDSVVLVDELPPESVLERAAPA
ncbi:CBS domain-containing protein [Natronococcus wangiae]|uniref:CBS domain-containing protein n=1 Tax=Natronococcus wangiae TaxID=3068275 RepID=UPI00273DC942|nr:CBS domain-containing protein [Natronococcus sp. AD5]